MDRGKYWLLLRTRELILNSSYSGTISLPGMTYNNPDFCVLSCKQESGSCDSLPGHGGKKLSVLYLHLLKDGPCRYNPQNASAKIEGFVALPEYEDVLMDAVANEGPITAAIDALHESFKFYSEG